MFRIQRAFVAVSAVVALQAMSQAAFADGVVISGRTDVWATSISAAGNENGSWTGRGSLADHSGGGQDVYLLDVESGGIFDGVVMLSGTATFLGSGAEWPVTIVANPETGEWEIDFVAPWLWIAGYEPVGIGMVRLHQ